MTRATWRPADRAWLTAHPGEGLPPSSSYGRGHDWNRGIGPKSAAKPAVLTPEERTALLAEGQRIASRDGLRPATLIALAILVRIGTGQ